MVVEPTIAVKSEFDTLNSAHQQAVLQAPVLQNRWVSKVAQEFGLSEEVVRQELEKISAIRNGEVEELVQKAELEVEAMARAKAAEDEARKLAEQNLIQQKLAEVAIIKNRLAQGMSIEQAESQPFSAEELAQASPDVAQDYALAQASIELDEPKIGTKQRKTYTRFMTEIVSALKTHPQGLTKSQILSETKRSGMYRKMRDEILLYLQSRRLVKQLNNKFIHTQNLGRVLETDFHRKVYESLADGPLSITGVVTLKDAQGKAVVGYNNATGRRKVKQVLDLLWREGLVRKNTNNQYYIVRPEP